MELPKLIPPSTSNGKGRYSASRTYLSPSSKLRRTISNSLFCSKRKCFIPIVLGVLIWIGLFFYVCFLNNGRIEKRPTLLDQSFWDPLVAPEYLHLLNGTSNESKLFLLEPYILALIYAKNGTDNERDQLDRWNSLRWYFQTDGYWDWQRSRITVGIFADQWDNEINLSPFKETLRISEHNNLNGNSAVRHVFYQKTNPNVPWSIPLSLHLVVLHRDPSRGLWIAPISEEAQARLKNIGITLNLPQYKKFYNPSAFALTSIDGIRLPANITQYLAETIQSPAIIRDRVRYVDEQLRKLSSQVAMADEEIASQTYTNETSLNTIQELERATHILLDINQPCGGNRGRGFSLVVLVMNRVTDFARRQVIRNTYGSALKQNNQTAIYFMVARSYDSNVEKQIQMESTQYNDLIQVDYLEHYYNLTVKTVAFLRWTSINCPYSRYTLKFDDDSFIRLNPLLTQLANIEPNSILGRVSPYIAVNRHLTSKWYISPRIYPDQFYPRFINGAILVPSRLAPRLYEAIVAAPRNLSIPALPFDDVYLTGILASKVAIPREPLDCLHHLSDPPSQASQFNTAWSSYCIILNQLNSTIIQQLWTEFGAN